MIVSERESKYMVCSSTPAWKDLAKNRDSVLVITEHLNIAISDFNIKKSTRYSQCSLYAGICVIYIRKKPTALIKSKKPVHCLAEVMKQLYDCQVMLSKYQKIMTEHQEKRNEKKASRKVHVFHFTEVDSICNCSVSSGVKSLQKATGFSLLL